MIEADDRFDVQPSVGNHFAWLRTMMGLQRTLLAAVRTSVSLIGFGFTVAQFFEKLLDRAPLGLETLGPDAPRNLGLVLIFAGVVSLSVFTYQYHQVVLYLKSGPLAALAPQGRPLHTSTYLISFVVIAIGIAAFVSVFLRF